jgi:hypothetical protein
MSSLSDNSHVRFWAKVGVSGDIASSFNVTSVTDDGSGILTVTIATDFSSANWVCGVCVENADAGIDNLNDGMFPMIANASQTAGSIQLLCKIDDGSAAADPVAWHVWGMGSQ